MVDAREAAPLRAHERMFDSNLTGSETGMLWLTDFVAIGRKNSSVDHCLGWKAVAVPGELYGLWEEYKNFGGNVPWPRLIEPTLKMMDVGVPVSQALEAALEVREAFNC